MSLFPASTALVTWKRATALVLDRVAVAATLSGSRVPVRESCIQVQVTGSPSGTVTVSGTVNGSAGSEVLTWVGDSGYRVTKKQFTGALSFATSLAGAVEIEALAVGPGGDPQVGLVVVRGPGHPVSIEDVTEGTSPTRREGGQEEGSHRLLAQYEEVWVPRRGDRVVNDYDGEVYEVMKVETKAGGLFVSHWACLARRLDGKGAT